MFPSLLPRIGKGDAARGIQKQIMRHLPNCYKPIMRMVSPLFNECVEQQFQTKEEQLALLEQLVTRGDLTLIKYYHEQLYWDVPPGQLMERAFESKASVEMIAYLYKFYIEPNEFSVDELLIIHNRQDVFDYLISNTAYKPYMVGFVYDAVTHLSIWPFEWIIKKNILPSNRRFTDVFDCLANSDFAVSFMMHNQKSMMWLRQLLRLIINYTFDYRKLQSGVTSFYKICFLIFVESKRESDFDLFHVFYLKFCNSIGNCDKFFLPKSECDRLSKTSLLAMEYLKLLKAGDCQCNNKEIHRQ